MHRDTKKVRKWVSGGKARQAEGTAGAKALRLEGEKRPVRLVQRAKLRLLEGNKGLRKEPDQAQAWRALRDFGFYPVKMGRP